MTDPTPTDWRALCAELAKQLEGWQCYASPDGPNAEVLARARAALAQPEPQEAMIPDQYKGYQVHVYRAGFHAGYTHGLTRANAALAQPEPQVPTDEELLSAYDEFDLADSGDDDVLVRGLRAVLARWGTPAIEPVPVAERLPGWRDCDKNDCVWVEEPDRYVLRPIEKSDIRQNRRWLPHHALPVPQQEAE